MQKPLVTVVTPTYNRSSYLPSLFESLRQQSSKDFEWVVVDDGSTDDTRQVVERFKALAPPFEIEYIYKANGGKHTAVNVGVGYAKGELTLVLDSDDELPSSSIADIAEEWDKAKDGLSLTASHEGKPLGGVCGYISHRNGQIIGHPVMSVTCDEQQLRYLYNVRGDMCEVIRTDVLRKYPFPEIDGERFCPEILVFNRIAAHYDLHVFAKVIYLRDYLDGGLTDNIIRIRMKSPVASIMTYAEMLSYNISYKFKAKAAINYWRFRCCAWRNVEVPRVSLKWVYALPLGWMMHLRDLFIVV